MSRERVPSVAPATPVAPRASIAPERRFRRRGRSVCAVRRFFGAPRCRARSRFGGWAGRRRTRSGSRAHGIDVELPEHTRALPAEAVERGHADDSCSRLVEPFGKR
ncbi:hypothetical protein ACFZBU_41545 [Embleya sp. NPDC008237]|uniref:imine reductase family protein n=1 Tax=Embleya sp. NPDC008237 TaxID=3363978 RepID=UPI0036E0D043